MFELISGLTNVSEEDSTDVFEEDDSSLSYADTKTSSSAIVPNPCM